MPYRMAGVDVHKKKLAVVVTDVEVEEEYRFERRWFGSNPEQLRALSDWLIERQVEEVVMESTAQYWKPVWGALERCWKPTCQSRMSVLLVALNHCQTDVVTKRATVRKVL